MTETGEQRSRRKFNVGVLEQLGATFSALAGGAIVATVVAQLVATLTSSGPVQLPALTLIVAAGSLGSIALICAAAYLKGSAKQLDDDPQG